jgi:hypothetical protein
MLELQTMLCLVSMYRVVCLSPTVVGLVICLLILLTSCSAAAVLLPRRPAD